MFCVPTHITKNVSKCPFFMRFLAHHVSIMSPEGILFASRGKWRALVLHVPLTRAARAVCARLTWSASREAVIKNRGNAINWPLASSYI